MDDEAEIRDLIERWCDAVRRKDLAEIRKDRDADILMMDLPPPLYARGIDDSPTLPAPAD
jgi:ketosteroid isomerase-like protein